MQPFIAGVSDLTASKAREGMGVWTTAQFQLRTALWKSERSVTSFFFLFFFFKEKAKHGLF